MRCVVYLRGEGWCSWYLSPEHQMESDKYLLEVFRDNFQDFEDDFNADGELTLSVCLGVAGPQKGWYLFKPVAQQLLEQVRQDPSLSSQFTIKPAGLMVMGPNMHASFTTVKKGA